VLFFNYSEHTSLLQKAKPVRTNVELHEGLRGCPVGFALTAKQPVIPFVCSLMFHAALYTTPSKNLSSEGRHVEGGHEHPYFGCVFAMNIALNSFSLGCISIAVDLIIRSCLPLTAHLLQQGLAMVKLYKINL